MEATEGGLAMLVVDDSSTMRRIVVNMLGQCGHKNVAEAVDGAEALKQCETRQFDCVFTDWNMPNMNGLELTIQLRQKPNYAKVPIMMITTEGGKKDVIDALTSGVTAYIVKPFTPPVFKEKVTELLSKRG
jgi:two-component system chemotaxis response regulator CheY